MNPPAATEDGFSAVVSVLREAALLAYSSGEVRDANAAAADMLGEARAQLRGRHLSELVAEVDALRDLLRAASRTTAPVFGRLIVGPPGSRTTCRCEGSVLVPATQARPALLLLRLIPRDAAVNRFVALNLQRDELAREVSRRRAAEAALRASEARFRMMADEMPQLAWMAHPDGSIYWYNRRWYEYTGMTPERMAECGWQSLHEPQMLPAVLERWRSSIVNGTPFDMVFPLRGADGRFRPFLTRVAPFRDDDGRVVHWFGTNTDVSAQQAAEEALRAADRRKDEFLATLAHELRNPLAPIRHSVELLQSAGPLSEVGELARQILDRQVAHLTRLVDELLEISRITQGKVHLRKERISLVQPIREALESIAPAAKAANQHLHVRLPDVPLVADADRTRMTQIFLNLLSNAVKFTPPGGHIWLNAQPVGSEAVVSVRDTGLGIAAEHLETVFEMFSQPTPALDRSADGLGIGLSLVRGLVGLHGGTVLAKSPGRGKGSEFVVTVPLCLEVPQADVAAPASSARGAVPRKRILVVDDNVDAATSLRKLLELYGHEVREAHDAIEGIHAAGDFRPQLVLLDIGMPRMNGYEAAKEMRKQSYGKSVRIVALTGWGQESAQRLAHEAGFDFHLTKPVDLAALERLLED